jgi:hypothetical protein
MPLARLLAELRLDEDDATLLLNQAFNEAWSKIVASQSPLADEPYVEDARLCWPSGWLRWYGAASKTMTVWSEMD